MNTKILKKMAQYVSIDNGGYFNVTDEFINKRATPELIAEAELADSTIYDAEDGMTDGEALAYCEHLEVLRLAKSYPLLNKFMDDCFGSIDS